MKFLFNLYLIHNQHFSCVRLKISSSSTTSSLKTTLFLWLHISDTIATHIPFYTVLILLLQPITWKLWKCEAISSCLTVTFSTHLSHWSQTLCITLHKLIRCWVVLAPSWHKGQDAFPNCTPPFLKFFLVGNLSRSIFHAQTIADGDIFRSIVA